MEISKPKRTLGSIPKISRYASATALDARLQIPTVLPTRMTFTRRTTLVTSANSLWAVMMRYITKIMSVTQDQPRQTCFAPRCMIGLEQTKSRKDQASFPPSSHLSKQWTLDTRKSCVSPALTANKPSSMMISKWLRQWIAELLWLP